MEKRCRKVEAELGVAANKQKDNKGGSEQYQEVNFVVEGGQ
jgi:hypothetical protein